MMKNKKIPDEKKGTFVTKILNMDFSGERIVPDHPELNTLFQEHVIRYLFASQFTQSKVVLDAGCGTGYGSYLLCTKRAKKVIGIDNSKDAIKYCKKKYQHKKLEFKLDDVTKTQFSNHAFDVITSFEVIEHLKEPTSFLSEMKRILKKDGIFLISTPNKLTYPSGNPFHFKEYIEKEFYAVLKKEFKHVSIFYQKYPPTLAIYKPGTNDQIKEFSINDHKSVDRTESALYFVAICSDKKISQNSGMLYLFDKNTLLLDSFPDLQNWINILQNDLKEQSNQLIQLQNEFDERTNWTKDLDEQIKAKDEALSKLQNEFDERTNWTKDLDEQIKAKDEALSKLQNEFDENSEEIKKLNEELQKEGEKLKSFQKDSAEIKDLAILFDDELLKKSDEYEKKYLEFQNTINQKDSELSTKKAELDELQAKIFNLNSELETIKQSIIFHMFKRITGGLDKIFPPLSKRAENLRLAKMGYLTYKNEGFSVLASASKQKFKKKSTKKNINKKTKTLPTVLETKAKNFLIESHKDDFKPDKSLRNFLEFNAGNILSLPKYPKVSIIITTFDQVELLKKNIDSIKSKTTYKNFEIIIVTNNTDPNSEMRKFLNSLDCKTYVHEEEYSFSKMNNFGASNAEGEFLLFLNDDVEIQSPNWLEAFLQLGLKKSVGAVGAKLLFPNGRLQEAGCIVWREGNAWNYGRNADPNEPDYNYVRDVDYCSGACLFVNKEIFNKIGGFDSRYHPAYSEDVELCFSIKKLGHRVLYQPLSSIIHYEGATQGTNVKTGIKSYQILNQKKFTEKWQNELDSHLEDIKENTFFERDRQKGINILFIDHYLPQPDKDSGSLRTFRILSILRYLGNRVTFWPENMAQIQPYTTELQQKGIEVIYGSQNFSKFLDDRKEFYDMVILSRPYVAVKFIDMISSKMPHCPIIYDTTDLHFLRMKRQQTLNKEQVSDDEVKKMHDMELSLMTKSDLTILTSREEAKILHSEDDSLKFIIISNINETREKSPNFEERQDMMFLGGFQHPPNVDSVEYLVKEIFPLIKQKLPQTNLYIVGSNPPEKITNLASKDVIVTGFVRDLDSYYDKCRIMLSPLRFGAGIKGKITQSLGKGLPVITSNVGAEGIDLIDGENCMISDEIEEFASKAIRVYEDKILWNKISQNGLKTANIYSPETAKEQIKKFLISKN